MLKYNKEKLLWQDNSGSNICQYYKSNAPRRSKNVTNKYTYELIKLKISVH